MERPIPTLELWAFFALQARELPTLYPKAHWQGWWKSYQGMSQDTYTEVPHIQNFSRGTRRTRQNYVMNSLPRDKILFQGDLEEISIPARPPTSTLRLLRGWIGRLARVDNRRDVPETAIRAYHDPVMQWLGLCDLVLKALPSLSGQSKH